MKDSAYELPKHVLEVKSIVCYNTSGPSMKNEQSYP